MNIPRILVAGTQSGVGKTTVTLGLLDGLRRRGWRVQPFKVGPDFIDPSLHTLAAGRHSRNLDSFLVSEAGLREIFQHAVSRRGSSRADMAVIEGVMGCFDGYSGNDERGSSSQIAKLFGCPVLLVVNAHAYARTLGAVVEGFLRYDPRVHIAGVFLNGVAGKDHLTWLQQALKTCSRPVPVLGWMHHDPALHREERHLGLIPAAERSFPAAWLSALRKQMDKQVEWNKLSAICRRVPPLSEAVQNIFIRQKRRRPPRIAVAKDAAFCFYYQDNLDLLADRGAEVVEFSPLSQTHLPKAAAGLYLGGGYPELHAEALSRNRALRREVRQKASMGMPIYGECGGLMYLGNSLTDLQGRRHSMSGVLPVDTCMDETLKLAYVHARARKSSWLFPAGTVFPGHIFHFSSLKKRAALEPVYRLRAQSRTEPDGYMRKRVLAGYLHVHFASRPSLADRFVRHASLYGREARH